MFRCTIYSCTKANKIQLYKVIAERTLVVFFTLANVFRMQATCKTIAWFLWVFRINMVSDIFKFCKISRVAR